MEPLSANDPQVVGEYQLRARLGAGGMGRVYLGYSRAGRAVAVKVIHPQLAQDPEFRQRFGREVAAARAVSGMYTAAVVAAGLNDDPPWLATAFVPGPCLSDVVSAHGPLPETAIWRLAAGLAEALSAVHECGLVHRDLKPANVLLAADGPHVIDFGISRALDGTSVTATGMVVGTPGYMSPEQAEGAQAGPAGDVFSLGCVLAYAATGNAPFGGGSAASVLYRVVRTHPDLTGVPGKLRDVIMACMAKDPAQRPGLGALSTMIAQAGPAHTATPTSFWPAPVAEIIRAASAYPTQVSPVAGSPVAGGPVAGSPIAGSPARPSMAQAGAGQAGFAQAGPGQPGFGQPGLGQPGLGQPDFGQSGFGQPGPGFGVPEPGFGQPGPGFGQPGQAQASPAQAGSAQGGWTPAPMVPDGYMAAATSSMAASPANTPTFGMTAPAQQSSWPPGSPGQWQPGGPADQMSRYTPAPLAPKPPTSVAAAAWLMYSGAALSLIDTFATLGIIGDVKKTFIANHPFATQSFVQKMAGIAAAEVLIFGGVVVALWLWLAFASKQGHAWARTVGTVLFGIDTFALFITLGQAGIGATKGISVVVWLIGLVTVILLWQRSAANFFSIRR
jgi:hypothetical protein